ncbi:MAG TPA: HEAT repeat domain-containing protein [Rhodothermales bacterium]|nr:HEAT repeat domain-containing protein [Rhodothermales bacterium]
MSNPVRTIQPEEEARRHFVRALAVLDLDSSLTTVLSTSATEDDRKFVRQGVLRSLGFNPMEVESWERSDEDYRARETRQARIAGSAEKAAGLGVLTLLLVYTHDWSPILEALTEIDLNWAHDPGCRAWCPWIATIARQSPNPDVRLQAVHTLEKIGDPSVADSLVDVLATDDDISVNVEAAYALLGIAESLGGHPQARAVLATAADPRNFDRAPNLVRYATQALERMGAGVAPAVAVDWTTIVDDQVSPSEIKALLSQLSLVNDTLVRFYGVLVSQPSAESVGTLLLLFSTYPDLALVHGEGRGHLFARTEVLRELKHDVADYRQLVEAIRACGHRTGYVPSVSI